jgi:hypothetical protein
MVTAVLKVDMHCDGCAKRIRGSVHRYTGKQCNATQRNATRNLSCLSVAGATPSCDVRQAGGGSGGGMEWNGTYARQLIADGCAR